MSEEPRKPKKGKKPGGGLSGESLGGMLAGFDQAVFRTTPPPHELVLKGSPVRGLTGADGVDDDGSNELIITLPGGDDVAPEDPTPDSTDEPSTDES